MKNIFSLMAFLCLFTSCVVVSKVNPKAKNINHIYFFQEGISYAVKEDIATLSLKPLDFSIQYFNKPVYKKEGNYNITRIVSVPNKAELDKLHVGLKTETVKNLESGSGLAVSTKYGYNGDLFINDYGHHILYYDNEEERTVDKIGVKSDFSLFEFKVAQIFKEPNFIPVKDTGLAKLYFAIFRDYNNDKIIDKGELKKIIITLEK